MPSERRGGRARRGRRRSALIAGLLLAGAAAGCTIDEGEDASATTGSTTTTAPPPLAPSTDPRPFVRAADEALAATGVSILDRCDLDDPAERRLVSEYGAIFVAPDVVHPPTCTFADQAATEAFQASVPARIEDLHGTRIRLQDPAMDALLAADAELQARQRQISPRGDDAARRDHEMTVSLWQERLRDGLEHWRDRGRLDDAEVVRILGLPASEQLAEVVALEEEGLWLSASHTLTILSSVAPPGTSQHISMLALDIVQDGDPLVRGALARHGWFQTVVGDDAHFTYLGLQEAELPAAGLRRVERGDRVFWVPDLVTDR